MRNSGQTRKKKKSRTTSSHCNTFECGPQLEQWQTFAPLLSSTMDSIQTTAQKWSFDFTNMPHQQGKRAHIAHSHEREQIAYECHWMPATAIWKKAGLQFRGKKNQTCPAAFARSWCPLYEQTGNHSAPCTKLCSHPYIPNKNVWNPATQLPWLGSQYTRHWMFFLRGENGIVFMRQGSVSKWH